MYRITSIFVGMILVSNLFAMDELNENWPAEFVLFDDVKIILVNKKAAVPLLTVSDEFTKNLSSFDLQGRLKKQGGFDEQDYLKSLKRNTANWTKKELRIIEEAINNIGKKLTENGFRLSLPDTIYFLKTNGKDEGGAAYTRRNIIILNKRHITEKTLIHELFHVYSRHNPEMRDRAYAILGFNKCEPLSLPADLDKRRITNPDVAINQHYLSLRKNGEIINLMMITYAKEDYKRGNFFDYLNKGLLKITLDENNIPQAVMENGKAVIFNYNEIDELDRHIGKNTLYNIHPEEISADHFMFMLSKETSLPNQDLVDQLARIIKEYESK